MLECLSMDLDEETMTGPLKTARIFSAGMRTSMRTADDLSTQGQTKSLPSSLMISADARLQRVTTLFIELLRGKVDWLSLLVGHSEKSQPLVVLSVGCGGASREDRLIVLRCYIASGPRCTMVVTFWTSFLAYLQYCCVYHMSVNIAYDSIRHT